MAVLFILPISWGILFGLVLAHSFELPKLSIFISLSLSLLTVPWLWFYKLNRATIIATFFCGTCLGVMIWLNAQTYNQYQNLIGAQLNTTGTIIDRPTTTASGNQALIIRPDGFSQDLRASLFHHTVARGGERVWIRGQIKQPENFSNFNYVKFLEKNNVYAELGKAKIIVIGLPPENLGSWLGILRQQVIRRSERVLNEESSAIILGMLIGQKEQLPTEIETAFQKSGLIHILVVSGFNLTIIALGVGVLATLFGRRRTDLFALLLIWQFVILVGASAAVVRAGIMSSILILARLSGRLAAAKASLLIAVVVMCIFNPLQLFYDIGFQLSVAATIGVLEASRWRARFGKEDWLSELLWPSLGAIVCTAPLIANYFGTFSLVAPLANLLVLPMIPYLMLFGALALLPVAQLIFVPLTEFLVAVQLYIVNWLANWQYSQLQVQPHFSILLAYYFILILIVWFMKHHQILQLKESTQRDTITKIII
jgi:competence protein ComEC